VEGTVAQRQLYDARLPWLYLFIKYYQGVPMTVEEERNVSMFGKRDSDGDRLQDLGHSLE
jgi:hypothetical protein